MTELDQHRCSGVQAVRRLIDSGAICNACPEQFVFNVCGRYYSAKEKQNLGQAVGVEGRTVE